MQELNNNDEYGDRAEMINSVRKHKVKAEKLDEKVKVL